MAAAVVCLSLWACGGDESDSGPTGPSGSPALRARFEIPTDSQTLLTRVVYMRLDADGFPALSRVIFYIDGVSSAASVDSVEPYAYSGFDTSWQHGTWHQVSALLDAEDGRKWFSDTIDFLFVPDPRTDTLLQSARYSMTMEKLYAVTKPAYAWDAFNFLVPWIESTSDGTWHVAKISSQQENDEIRASLPPGINFWVGGHMDSSYVWRWYDGSLFDYQNWTGPPPQNLVEDGLLLKADGFWTDGLRTAKFPLVLEATWD